ncbi:hypothetical protein MNV49_001484 [Pseudohyphozyma bogoriensis]|nr:hypothetical protein MNV49_001484 [Pseudohyphozyma bogoriensis]
MSTTSAATLSLSQHLSSPVARHAFASTLLAIDTDADVHPLSLLLFLLDALEFLRSADPHRPPATSEDGQLGVGLGIDGGDEADLEEYASDSASEAGMVKEKRRQRSGVALHFGGFGSVNARPRKVAGDLGEAWDDWSEYIKEVYAFNPPTRTVWSSPLPISPTIDLDPLFRYPTIASLHSILYRVLDMLAGTTSVGVHAPSSESSSPTSTSPAILSALLSEDDNFPPPMSHSVITTIASTLSSLRRASPPCSPNATPARSTNTFVSVLTTLLAQHFPAPSTSDTSHVLGSALPVAGFFKARRQEFAAHEDDDVEVVDVVHGPAKDGVREASLSIQRRDDKLRWIFGDNFQTSRLSSPSSPSSSPPKPTSALSSRRPFPPAPQLASPPRKMPPSTSSNSIASQASRRHSTDSFASLSSQATGFSYNPTSSIRSAESMATTTASAHRRGGSLSSTTPLIASSESTLKAPTSLTPPPSTPPSQSIISLPSHSDHPPPSPVPSAPFKNFNPVPIQLEPRLPKTVNNLSQDEKRDLVRKSRKLEKVFGVPIEENAAEVVLVKSIGVGKERRMSFPHGFTAGKWTGGEEMRRGHSTPSFVAGISLRTVGSRESTAEGLEERREYHDAQSNAVPFTDYGKDKEKEERRRKVDKLGRLLGERVPAELLRSSPGAGSVGSKPNPPLSTGMSRSGSGGAGGRFGALIKAVGRRGSKNDGSGETSGKLREPFPVMGGRRGSYDRYADINGVEGLRELNTTRKIEQLLGVLPPRSFHYPSHARSRSTPPAPPSPSLDGPSSNPSTINVTFPRSHSIEISRSRSIDSYRHSIASLTYLAERDPAALDEVARVYRKSLKRRPSLAGTDNSPMFVIDDGEDAEQPEGASDELKREELPPAEAEAEAKEEETGISPISPLTPETEGNSSSSGFPFVSGEIDFSADSDADLWRTRDLSDEIPGGVDRYGFTRESRSHSVVSSVGSAWEVGSMRNGRDSLPHPRARLVRQDSERLEGTTEEEEEQEEPEAVDSRRASTSSLTSAEGQRRTFKKAQKLAGFFGTSRGEVWGMLLDDLEAAVEEEEDLDEDERSEVLNGVARLRRADVNGGVARLKLNPGLV